MPRCVGKDKSLMYMPSGVRGNATTANRNAENIKWTRQTCCKCEGDVYVNVMAVHKYGHCWTCKACKEASKNEVNRAIIATEKRRAEIKKRLRKRS